MTRRIALVFPATNTTTPAECDALAPPGVANIHARIAKPDQAVRSDADTLAVRRAMLGGLLAAVEEAAAQRPDALILGVMVENFAGPEAPALLARVRAAAGCPVTDYTSAILAELPPASRIGLLTPFMPVGDAAARRLFEEAGHAVMRLEGLRAPSPAAIAAIGEDRLSAAVAALDGPDVTHIVQVGTNLRFAALAAAEQAARGKPVLASNPVLYRHALRALT